jgi:hypothetical protein
VAQVSYVLLVNTACGLFPFLDCWDCFTLLFATHGSKTDCQGLRHHKLAGNVYKMLQLEFNFQINSFALELGSRFFAESFRRFWKFQGTK